MYNEIWNGIESEMFQILPAHSAGFFVMGVEKRNFAQIKEKVNTFPTRLVTTNKIKQSLFRSIFPQASFSNMGFDEEKIKNEVPEIDGLSYFAEISRRKATEAAREESGTIIFTADSGTVVKKDGKYLPINRDSTSYEKEFIEAINRDGEITFIGALSVASGDTPPYTIQTYLTIPLDVSSPITKRDISYEELEERYNNSGKKAKQGHLTNRFENGNIDFAFGPPTEVEKFGDFYSHLSGVEKSSAELLSAAMQSSLIFSEAIGDVIESDPFNTFRYIREPRPAIDSKDGLQKGGDCNFFTHTLSKALSHQGVTHSIGVYDVEGPDVTGGHCNIVLPISVNGREDDLALIFEPGLSIPTPIPTSNSLDFYPVSLPNGKKALTIKDENGDTALAIQRTTTPSTGRSGLFTPRGVIKPEGLTQHVSTVIEPLRQGRNETLVWEAHDRDGGKKKGAAVKLYRNGTITNGSNGDEKKGNILSPEEIPPELEGSLGLLGIGLAELNNVFEEWSKIGKQAA